MSKHTPGPWRYTGEWEDVVSDEGGICRMYRRNKSLHADGRLIASAPELLEHLKSALEILYCDAGEELGSGRYNYMEEVIKYIEGDK